MRSMRSASVAARDKLFQMWVADPSLVHTVALVVCVCCDWCIVWLQLVHKFKAHETNTRDLSYDPRLNMLATCSFDKTVKIFAQAA